MKQANRNNAIADLPRCVILATDQVASRVLYPAGFYVLGVEDRNLCELSTTGMDAVYENAMAYLEKIRDEDFIH